MGLLDTVRSWIETDRGSPDDYEVEEYVLERRDPDPNPRVMTFDDAVTPDDVQETEDLPSGEYLLQEVKTTGTVGEVVWEADLTSDDQG